MSRRPPPGDGGGGAAAAEARPRPALGIEIRRVQPFKQRRAPRRPLVLEQGIVGAVAAHAAAGDHVRPEHPVQREAEALRRATGGRVQRVGTDELRKGPEIAARLEGRPRHAGREAHQLRPVALGAAADQFLHRFHHGVEALGVAVNAIHAGAEQQPRAQQLVAEADGGRRLDEGGAHPAAALRATEAAAAASTREETAAATESMLPKVARVRSASGNSTPNSSSIATISSTVP